MTVSVNPVQKQDSDFDQILRAVQIAGSLFSDFKSHKESAQKLAADMAKEKAAGERQSQIDVNSFNEKYEPAKPGMGLPSVKPPVSGLGIPQDQEYALRKPQETEKSKLELLKLNKEISQLGSKPLQPASIENFGQGREAIKQLNELEKTVSNNTGEFGPIQGRLGSWNPYATTAQSVQAAVNTAKQTIGKYLEGGVLRKEDEEKYARILPTLKDTPEVAAEKINLVRGLLTRKMGGDVEALKAQGWDVSGINVDKSVPEKKPEWSGSSGKAYAAPASNISPNDAKAELRKRGLIK